MKRIRTLCVIALSAVASALAGCAENRVSQQPDSSAPVQTRTLNQTFSQAGNGLVIPDSKPDAEALALAARCGTGGGGSVALGMSECSLVGVKGTPSRFVGGEDQNGHSHDAIWYIEGGVRTVYKFDDDKLITIIR